MNLRVNYVLNVMADIVTHFPPQTYSSSFFLNSINEDEKKTKSQNDEKPKESSTILDCFIKTMLMTMPRCGLTIISILLYVQLGTCIECIIDNEHKIRTFRNMSDFHRTSTGFAPRMGNVVRFETNDIGDLYADIFVINDSDHIVELDLSAKNIAHIEENAFASLACVHVLDLHENKITNVSEKTFYGLRLVKELILNNNKLEEIHGSPFVNLRALKHLDLSENRINYLSSKSFWELSNLEILDLSHNYVHTIYSETFSNLVNLRKLILSFNKLERVEAENWRNLPNLDILNLADNELKAFELNQNYTFRNLRSLILDNNRLTHLAVYALRTAFPNLTTFKIDNNNWDCMDISTFVVALNDSHIDYMGNSYNREHRHGIACKSVVVPDTTIAPLHFVSLPPGKKYEPPTTVHPAVVENQQLNKTVNSLKFAVTCLSVLLVSFVVFEAVMRMRGSQRLQGLCGNNGNRQYPYYIDDSYSEHIQLTRN